MKRASVSQLKTSLSAYLLGVKRGEEVIVTERGRPVAVLQSLQRAAPTSALDTRLASLAALGIITLPTRKKFGRTRPARLAGPAVSKAILEDRR